LQGASDVSSVSGPTPTVERAPGRHRLLAQIVTITPTAYETWKRCPREYLLTHVLSVPPSDSIRPTDHGLLLHELLRIVHERGTCHDDDHVRDVLVGHGVDDPHFAGMVARHAQRCPSHSDRAAHEVDLARFHRQPVPMFMAMARIDAIWVHDGILDARDYKTGSRWYERVGDDPRARVQAFVLAQHADRQGLRLRLRYEHLAPEVDDDPDPYEPDEDDLTAVEEELRATAAQWWALEEWRGVHDTAVCQWCRFRSVCVDSAAPGEPDWPVLAIAGADATEDRA
jgi:hypothetical protein